jgi:hypothetical protein
MGNGTTGIDGERIYFAAVRAAGPAEDIGAWRNKVDEIADQINAGLKAFRRKLIEIKNSIPLSGTVKEAIENPLSESGGRPLDLYKVVFIADAGTRPDQMWIDKRKPGGAALFAQAKALVGKRAQIVKEQHTQFVGDEPKTDNDGKEITSPYLGSIRALDEGAVQVSPTTVPTTAPADEAPEVGKAGEAVITQDEAKKLIGMKPKTASEVVQLALDHFAMDSKQVKQAVESVLGKPKRDADNKIIARTPIECQKAWSTIVQQHAKSS